MPKLNASRIVNLTYNNKSENAVNKIVNETFEMNGEHTLNLLRNGGGKTVQIQMLMSPFVSAKYRNLGSRTFEDYFTDEKNPTYIATEWLLENNDKVLIGLAVKKSSSISDEDNSKGLDIMSYVYEYNDVNDEFSIRNMPFARQTETGYTVLSMSEAEDLFKKLKSKNKFTFDYFNLNVDSNRSRYYKKLRSYSIEPTEWESLMRTINQDEGGLSKLFENAKTESALIESWFLKNIHVKLNKENEVIKEMGKSIKQYINNKVSKQNLIDTLKGIEDYNQYSEKILDVNEKYKDSIDKKNKKEKEIEELMIFNHQESNKLNNTLNECEENKNQLNRKLSKSKYEQESYEYYKAVSKMEDAENKKREEENELLNLKSQVETLERDEKIQDLINLHNQREDKVQDLETVKTKRDKELQSNEEIEKQLIDVTFTLKGLLDEEKISIENNINTVTNDENELNKSKSNTDKELINLKTKQGILESDIKRYEDITLANYNKVLESINDKYEVPMFIDSNFIENLTSSATNKLNNKEKEIETISNKIDSLNKDLENKKEEVNSKNIEVINLSNELKNLENESDKANKLCNEMIESLEYLGIEDKHKIFDTTYMSFKANDTIKHINDKIDYDTNEKSKKMNQLDMLNKGLVVEIPLEVKNKLDELGINCEVGLNYLNNLRISQEQKEELLNNNPYLPFSIMIDNEDMNLLENTDLEISTSYNVYVVNKDKLGDKINITKNNSLYKVDNLSMLFNFNKTLLDENKKKDAITNLEKDIAVLNRTINENREYLKIINRYAHKIESFDITEEYLNNLKQNIENLNAKIDSTKLSIEILRKEQDEITSNTIPKLTEDLNASKEELNKFQLDLNEINDFSKSYYEYEKETKEIENKRLEHKNNDNKINDMLLELDRIESKKNILEASLRQHKDVLKNTTDKLEEINNLSLDISTGAKLDIDKNKLEAQFKALKLKSSSSLEELEDRIKKLTKEISRIKNEMKSIISMYNVIEDEYIGKTYLPEIKADILLLKANKKKAIEKQQEVVTQSTVDLESAKADVNKKRKSCNKACEKTKEVYLSTGALIDFNEGILEISEIENTNFKETQESIKSELDTILSEINELEDTISEINSSEQKLAFLSDLKRNITDINEREVVLDIDSINELCTLTEKLISEYKTRQSDIETNKKAIDEVFALLTTEFKYKDIPPFSKNIQSLLEIRYEPITVIKSIESTLELLDRLKKQNEADLKVVNEERENISKTLLKYVEQTYSHLNMIDKNSRVDIDGESKKMLEIKQPDWDILLYSTKVNEFLDNITTHSERRITLGEPIDEYIATQVTTAKLYNFVVGIENVKINLRKLESLNNRIVTSKVKWKEIVKNSGGEGFVSAFVILVSLLSYMRRDNDTLGNKKEEGKVIIMDNPFGKMSSEHLIKPVMMIAEKYNAQLICYTAQKGDNIYNRFPNIYHMETEYVAGAKMNVLTATRENESKENQLKGSRFVIEEQQSMYDMFEIE